MNTPIRSKIIKIGNSRGIRIPRSMLQQASLKDEVELRIEGDQLIIQASNQRRHGWEAAFAKMAAKADDALVDENLPTNWDEGEWEW